MKVTLHIPTEQYGFVALELEVGAKPISLERESESVANLYQIYANAFKPKPINELPTKEWNRILDKYLDGGGITEEEHASLSRQQRELLHELDKADARRDPHNTLNSD